MGLAVDLGEVIGHHRHVLAARAIAYAIRCVKETLRLAALSSRRRASSALTVSVRKLVAVGIERDSSM